MFIIDSHCDSIQKVDNCEFGIVNPYNYSQKYKQVQFVAMMTGWPGDTEKDAWRRACRYTGLFCMSMASEADKVIQIKSYDDIERAFAEGKHGALLTIESATGIKGSPKLLEMFYNVGVRVVSLTWLSNSLGKSNRVFNDGEEDTGITDLGREIVAKGNDLGIIWDVSHASDKLFWDLAEITKKPLIATHSNFRALCSHSRNLTDDMAKHIIKTGGMIGLNLLPEFISDDAEKRTVADYFKHVDHCLELGGEDNIGFGGDVDGTSGRYPAPLDESCSIHDRLVEFMQKHYSERIVEKVAGANYMAYLKKYLR
jgi:membrane dipeptidase